MMTPEAKKTLRTKTNRMIADLRALIAHASREGSDYETVCYEEATKQLRLAVKRLNGEDTRED